MTDKKKRAYEIYQSLLGMILTFALILWVNDYYLLRVHLVVCIIYSIIPSVLIYIIDRNKKSTLSYLVVLGLICSAGLIFLLTKTNPITWASDIMEWIISYDGSEALYELAPAYTVLALVSIFASILLYSIVRRVSTRLILGLLLAALLVILSIFKIHMAKLVVGILIFYILNILIELSGILYGRKTGKKEKRKVYYICSPYVSCWHLYLSGFLQRVSLYNG